MRTELPCLPCFFGQVSRTLRHAGVNGDDAARIMRRAADIIEQEPLSQAPARISTRIHRMIRSETGIDPYQAVKADYTKIALGLLERFRPPDPWTGREALAHGIRVAIAGNVIDFGIYDDCDLDRSLEESLRAPLSPRSLNAIASAVDRSRSVLYLCDNAGEIVFDRVLLDILRQRGKAVTVGVKGGPVINDATREDAEAAGIDGGFTVIDNGSDGIGTLLETCSEGFLNAYRAVDMIISKGQANYETLSPENDPRIFFLFKVKCTVVAQHLHRPLGDIVLTQGGSE